MRLVSSCSCAAVGLYRTDRACGRRTPLGPIGVFEAAESASTLMWWWSSSSSDLPGRARLGASHGLADIVAIRTPPGPSVGRGSLQGDLPDRIAPSTCASMLPPDTT